MASHQKTTMGALPATPHPTLFILSIPPWCWVWFVGEEAYGYTTMAILATKGPGQPEAEGRTEKGSSEAFNQTSPTAPQRESDPIMQSPLALPLPTQPTHHHRPLKRAMKDRPGKA